ncbi:MAG: hypothetical protein FJX53_03005 [Alphaproteobacteria bacterium]|nr:hypothetical protein [Alphaproteobacteria bacterium]
MTTAPAFTVFDVSATTYDGAAARAALARDGVIVLRNLWPAALLDDLVARADRWLAHPAIAGVPGYTKVDAPKKLLNPCLLGAPALDAMLDERVLDIVEPYMNSECTLAEANLKFDRGVGYTYFPMHADFYIGWRKQDDTPALTREALDEPIGVGGAIYLHETHEGAFTYCLGTHRTRPRKGEEALSGNSPARQREILSTRARIDGQRGDFVLFDDRGYHGPDQPSWTDRTVILVDYYRDATFGRAQVSPMPVWSTDIGRLTPRQLRVLGAGAASWVPPHRYMGTRFRRNPAYGLVERIIENAYLLSDMKARARRLLRRRTDTANL